MKQYQDILKKILEHGVERENRTVYKDIFIPSATIEHDLRNGFPVLTTKQLYYKQSIGEILGFIRGYENADDFAKLGCKFWYSDANENKAWLNSPYRVGENDLGKVYGSTWRNRRVVKIVEVGSSVEDYELDNGYTHLTDSAEGSILTKEVDQLREVVDTIINNPNNRRIIMHAWFPELFDEMALPPCHVMYRFVPDEKNKVLHMSMFQRSCDALLGVPMNLFGSSLLLALIAEATGYTAGVFTHQMADVHLYENQIEAAKIQIEREPYDLPTIEIDHVLFNGDIPDKVDFAMEWLETIEPHNIQICGYEHHPALPKVEMAQEK